MEKKLYFTPATENFLCEPMTALCTSNMPSTSPGEQNTQPTPMTAPKKVF